MAKENKKMSASAKKTPVQASKRTMNLYHYESSFNILNVLLVAIIACLVGGLFLKFAVLDQMQKKTLAQLELVSKQEQLAVVEASLAGYDEVADLYGRYSYGRMNDTEINMVSRMDVLGLVEEKIAPFATISNLSVNNNELSMNISGVTLDEASQIVKGLEDNEMVSRATVNSANAADGSKAQISISISLTKPVPAEETAEEAGK